MRYFGLIKLSFFQVSKCVPTEVNQTKGIRRLIHLRISFVASHVYKLSFFQNASYHDLLIVFCFDVHFFLIYYLYLGG